MTSYLDLRDINKTFDIDGSTYVALGRVNLHIRRGEFITIIGHSGCGKSTLLNLIAGLIKPTSGSITLEEQPVSEPGPDRGMVFQHHGLLPWLSIYDNVYQAVAAVFPGRSKAEKAEDVQRVIRMVGLWEHRNKKPGQISDGMKQRTAVARAFAIHPKVLLLDEPFGALDALIKPTLHDALVELWGSDGQSETVFMVTHDIDEAIYLSDRIVVMTNGPQATIGEIVDVALPRPRDKRGILHMPEYIDLKDHLLYLLSTSQWSASQIDKAS
ncbi:MAG: ABC transporter ATP-binding protein [Dehalococcoidia bacterium]|nr:ABC transporter ATP-binding protein [Dehalococcoidia bacterium]